MNYLSCFVALPALFSLFLLQGCVSTSAHWKDKQYRPVKKGTLFYDPRAHLFDSEAVQKRRRDAEMKMKGFCRPQTPQIVFEKVREEVTGYRTEYSSTKDNPHPSYHSQQTTRAKDGALFSQSASSLTATPLLHSRASQTSTAIIRDRLYIDFICK